MAAFLPWGRTFVNILNESDCTQSASVPLEVSAIYFSGLWCSRGAVCLFFLSMCPVDEFLKIALIGISEWLSWNVRISLRTNLSCHPVFNGYGKQWGRANLGLPVTFISVQIIFICSSSLQCSCSAVEGIWWQTFNSFECVECKFLYHRNVLPNLHKCILCDGLLPCLRFPQVRG